MRTLVVIACLALVLWCGVAAAGSLEIPLPTLVGAWPAGTARYVDLDLGLAPDSVVGVSVRWAGSSTVGLGHGDGVERSTDWFAWPGELLLALSDTGGLQALGSIVCGDGAFLATTPIGLLPPRTWDFLEDGHCSLLCEMSAGYVIGGVMVIAPSATLTEVTLIVEVRSSTPVSPDTWGAIKARYR
jgi:hypothetical protein